MLVQEEQFRPLPGRHEEGQGLALASVKATDLGVEPVFEPHSDVMLGAMPLKGFWKTRPMREVRWCSGQAVACAIARLAALVRMSPKGEIAVIRLAWGSVGAQVVTEAEVPGLTKHLVGRKPSPALWRKAMASQAVSPIDDLRATAAFRRAVSGNILLRLIATLSERQRVCPAPNGE